ncbi:MAG: PilZ domain-containing protein [Gammaproteobacteria bacterium]
MGLLHGEYRRHNRTDIRTSVSLGLPGNQLNTKTLDISESGIALNKPARLNMTIGQSVSISFPKMPFFKISAKIVRTSDDNIGLELNQLRLSQIDIDGIVHTAPWYERLRYYSKRTIWKTFRRVGIFLANTALRRPLLSIIKPTFIFAAYGTEKDIGTYLTPRMSKMIPPLLLAGFIKNRGHKGILVAPKFFEHELAHDSNAVNQYLKQLENEFPHVKTIALVGRLPNFVMKAGHRIAPPYVDGSMGTRYMIWDISQQMHALPQYKNETSIGVLGGAGRIGSLVCNDLVGEYTTVIAFDTRYEKDEIISVSNCTILRTRDPKHLMNTKLYISLTHHGNAITDFMCHLPAGALLADDTHPCISFSVRNQLENLNIEVKKIVLFHPDFLMWPRMPAWSNRAIPGCLVEALVLLDQTEGDPITFDSFCTQAKRIGFQGQLLKPLNE